MRAFRALPAEKSTEDSCSPTASLFSNTPSKKKPIFVWRNSLGIVYTCTLLLNPSCLKRRCGSMSSTLSGTRSHTTLASMRMQWSGGRMSAVYDNKKGEGRALATKQYDAAVQRDCFTHSGNQFPGQSFGPASRTASCDTTFSLCTPL